MKLYHGGAPGLAVGDLVRSAAEVFPDREMTWGPHQPNYSPYRVYVTRLEWYARLFAHCSGGDLYEVRAHAAKPDVDARGSFWCPFARVVRVVERGPVDLPVEAEQFRPVLGVLLGR